MSSSRRELDDTAPATDVPSDPARRSRPDTFIPPTERYQLGNEIGRGGMGRVVEALDTKLGRTVALKEVLPRAGEAVERRFLREVRVTARLEHPSIVPLYDSGVNAEGRPFYVMRRVSGRPLDELIKRARGLDERLTLLPAVLRAIDAIAHAHKRGVIHRDVKPSNILVGELGESIVIDWGLAKVIGEMDADEPDSLAELKSGDSLQTQFGAVFGTPGFMPPEQARGEALGFGGDVYALGATLYQLLAGTPPHHGTSVTDVMDRTLRVDVTPLRTLAPGAPIELAAIVDKALAYDADKRYRDASELAEDVRRFEAGQLVAAHHYTSRQKLGRFVRRYRSLLLLGAIALTTLAVFGALGFRRIVASAEAERAARRDAEKRSVELSEQTHELTLANATALLETNPTKALAYLKSIPAKSHFANRARGLAQSAYARGVAWAMQGPNEFHRSATFSPQESRVLWHNLNSEVRIYDLEARRAFYTRTIEPGVDADWIDEDHIIFSGATPEIVDVRTGAAQRIAVPPVVKWSVSGGGSLAAATFAGAPARVVNLATGASAEIVRATPPDVVYMGRDGAMVAAASPEGLITFHEASGRQVGELERASGLITAMPDGSFVVTNYESSVRCRRAATPMCSELAINRDANDIFTSATLVGSTLLLATARHVLYAMDGDKRSTFYLMVNPIGLVKANTQVPLSTDSDAFFIPTRAGWFPLDVPVGLSRSRIVVGEKRVAVFGNGIIVVVETEPIMPRRIEIGDDRDMRFVTNDTIVAHGIMDGIDWVDASSLKVVAHTELQMPMFETWSTPDGSLLVTVPLSNDDPDQASHAVYYVPYRSPTLVPVTKSLNMPMVGAFPDGTVLVVRSGHEVLIDKPGRPRTPLMTLPSEVVAITTYDATRFAALLASKELVIADPATLKLERYPLPAMPEKSLLAARDGTLCAAFGRLLQVWRGGRFVEVGTFDAPPLVLVASRTRAVAFFADNTAAAMDLASGSTSALFESTVDLAWANTPYEVFATFTKATELELYDLETDVRWNFSSMYRRADRLPSLSPDGTRILISTAEGVLEWRLHRVDADYESWLNRVSNARITDGKLTWDWDAKPPSAP